MDVITAKNTTDAVINTLSNNPSPKWRPKIQISQKLKMYTSNRKNTFTLVTLQSCNISGVISAEKM